MARRLQNLPDGAKMSFLLLSFSELFGSVNFGGKEFGIC
jgi:hypothetical protein